MPAEGRYECRIHSLARAASPSVRGILVQPRPRLVLVSVKPENDEGGVKMVLSEPVTCVRELYFGYQRQCAQPGLQAAL